MNTTDWIVDLTLIALVLRQIKEGRLDRRFFLLPVAIVSWSVSSYLRAIPTSGHDLVLIGTAIGAGALLGGLSGMATRVRSRNGGVYVKAGAVAATLWILGTGTRLAFQLYASHGGAGAIANFSRAHDITTQTTWVDALLLMALTEVVVRLAVIGTRGYRLAHSGSTPSAPANQGRILVTA